MWVTSSGDSRSLGLAGLARFERVKFPLASLDNIYFQIVNLMMLHDSTSFTEEVTARAQVSWYTTTTTSLLPLNSLKPFLEIYEVNYFK